MGDGVGDRMRGGGGGVVCNKDGIKEVVNCCIDRQDLYISIARLKLQTNVSPPVQG